MLYKIINTYADESDFILNLIDDHPYIGWYMLLRLGESDTTKATLTRRECIEIIRKDGSYARNIFSYVYKAVDITVGNIQEKADSIFGTAYEHILLNGLEILSRFASIANITEQKKLVVLMIKIIDADVVRRFRVLNDWIRQVMNVLDERVKISMLNELLQCSGKKKSDVAWTGSVYERKVCDRIPSSQMPGNLWKRLCQIIHGSTLSVHADAGRRT